MSQLTKCPVCGRESVHTYVNKGTELVTSFCVLRCPYVERKKVVKAPKGKR